MQVIKTSDSISTPNNINIIPIKAFTDNYIWAIENSTHAAIVDPGDAEVCINYLESENIKQGSTVEIDYLFQGSEKNEKRYNNIYIYSIKNI